MAFKITVLNKDNEMKASMEGASQAVLAWKGEYEEGDRIEFCLPEKNRFYIVRVDDTMDESYIYATEDVLAYDIPFAEKKTSYNPKSFTGERHYLTIRYAADYEIRAYKNLAKNVRPARGTWILSPCLCERGNQGGSRVRCPQRH